jgi:alpha-1,6-mannosyltransferase
MWWLLLTLCSWRQKGKSWVRWLMAVGLVGLCVANMAATAFFLYVSHLNYSGGQAMASLHATIDPSTGQWALHSVFHGFINN